MSTYETSGATQETIELIATAPMGLEAVVSRELETLGYRGVKVENGRVCFSGTLSDICRTNLWMRTTERILIKVAQFPAYTFDELFEGVKAFPWADWIPMDGEFPVEGRSQKSQLSSVPACQGIVKKAVVEKLKQSYDKEWFAETGGRYVIEVALLNDIATITLDTTGPSLHKRGYRPVSTEAPMKETLAASLVLLSRWQAARPLYDPFCGSGTIAIEAALIAWNIAPGLRRSFNAEAWPAVPAALWRQAREAAMDALRDEQPLLIGGSDIDPAAIEIANASAAKAGLGGELQFHVAPAIQASPQGEYGCLITNPPYGERIGTQTDVDQALRQLSKLAARLPSWSVFTLSPSETYERDFGRRADKKRKLFNGRIECQLYQHFGPLPPRIRT